MRAVRSGAPPLSPSEQALVRVLVSVITREIRDEPEPAKQGAQ